MGEFADDMIDNMLDCWFDGSGSPRRRQKPKTFQSGVGNYMWRMADGSVINMYDMTEEHLANSAALARRRGNTGKADQLEEVLRGRYNNVGYPSA